MNDAQEPGLEPGDTQPLAGVPAEPAPEPAPAPATVEQDQLEQSGQPEQQDAGSPWAPPPPGTERSAPEPTRSLSDDLFAPSLVPPVPAGPGVVAGAGGAPLPPAAPGAPGAPVPPTADLTVRRPRRGSGSGPAPWVWPLVAALALVVGLGGGLLGALVYDRVIDDDTPSGAGYTAGGLSGVDLADLPPLEAPGTVAAVAEAVLPSTVQIVAEYGGDASGATGSGWVMDNDGHIVTNNHVVAEAAKDDGPIVVIDHERNRFEAKVIGRSPVYDLAILYVEDHDGFTAAKLGYSGKLRVGEPVVAIGSPLGLNDTVTSGIVSFLQRPVSTGRSRDAASYINAVQTDAAINPGNSGGPLLNMQGEVIGVNSAIATAGGGSVDAEAGNIGVGFAIPVEQVRVTADQILKTGKAQYPVIGAQVQTGDAVGGDGAELEEILKDSPAQEAGLRAGDLITHVNGVRVDGGIALIVAIRTYQPGQTIEFTVERGSKDMKVDITLDGEVG